MEYNKQYNFTSDRDNDRYNDNQVASTLQSQLIGRDFAISEQKKTQDLIELYEEMKKQREYMYSQNSDHSLDNLIESTDNHISILSTMISSSHSSTPKVSPASNITFKQTLPNNMPQPHLRPYINNDIYSDNNNNNIYPPNNNTNNLPNNSGFPNTNNNIPNIDNATQPNTNNNSNNGGLPNTNNNIPNINDTNNNSNNSANRNNNTNNTPNSNNTLRNRTRINARRSPLQSGLASIAKSIFNKVRPKSIISADKYRNRFHNKVIELSSCKPRNKLITNECNILRLLLLYITLHQHCRHCHTLSSIASERLEILTAII